MRTAVCMALLVIIPTSALGNRLFSIPTGTKILRNHVRFETQFDQGRWDVSRSYLGFGIDQNFDAELTSDSYSDRRRFSFDLGYNFLTPVADLFPGVSVGVIDAMNSSRVGRTGYVAVTFRYNQDYEHNADVPAEITVGFGVGSMNGFFTGAMLPVVDQFRLLTEFDTRSLTAGVELRPVRYLSARWMLGQHTTRVGVGLNHQF